MNKLVLSLAAASLCGTTALAADMPVKAPRIAAPAAVSQWDWAFGGALMSDYNFRGVSQSNRGPSATAYSETRFNATSNVQFYLASQYWAVTLPTDPTAEVDIFGGVRLSYDPVTVDIGAMYYYYPRERQFAPVPGAFAPSHPNGNVTLKDTDFWEVYGKFGWEVMKDKFAVGANVYYSPSFLNTGADGLYSSVTAKVTLPTFRANIFMLDEIGWYISGEFGHYWLGTTDLVPAVFTPAVNLPDYSTWNVGIAFTWKVATLDLRYYDTDLSRGECNVLTGDPGATFAAGNVSALNPGGLGSKWCDKAFIASLKFDLVASQNLK